jgi:hypothetical protein
LALYLKNKKLKLQLKYFNKLKVKWAYIPVQLSTVDKLDIHSFVNSFFFAKKVPSINGE